MDGNAVEAHEAVALRYALVDEHGIDVLHVRQTDEFVHGGIVADVALQVGMGVAPLAGGDAEHGHVEHVGLLGVDDAGLLLGHLLRDEVLLDGVGVDAVVDLRQLALCRPTYLLLLSIFQTLELANEIDLKLGTYPHGKLESNVLVGVGAAVASGLRDDADGMCLLRPFLGTQTETVQTGLTFNYVEFGTIKN